MVQFLGNALVPSGHEQVYKLIGRSVIQKVPRFVPGNYFRLNGNVALSEKRESHSSKRERRKQVRHCMISYRENGYMDYF